MAQIDVSDILSDPDFTDEMILVTRTPSINLLGENILAECLLVSVGCVQPASGKTIQRLPEALRVANVSSFWFRGQIVATAPGKYSSVICFKGQRYQVQMVFDWSNWGQGWCEGTAIQEAPA